ncbi:412_t:CDS:10 [Diversispora eburnea]|uniref:412_t:CDS:1 n=1 Tax=Diversispora eburnea TaxID=1213867 RepID=A0A9N8WG86_9GLOM|nr:412_t:CDS:10 [Diversispora eburnea]
MTDDDKNLDIISSCDAYQIDLDIDVLKKKIIVRKLDKRGKRKIHFINPEDARLFDNIKSWVKNHRNETFEGGVNQFFEEAIKQFSNERIGDALVKVIFDYPFPDFIIKYKNDKNKENHRKRRNFERLLLNTGLIVEREINLNGFIYMKIISPFERLCEQAQQMKIKFPLNKKDIQDFDFPTKSTIFSTIINFLSYKGKFNRHSASFIQEKLSEFEGISPTMSTSQIKLNFFNTAKRNLMVHRMIMTANHISQSAMINNKSTFVKLRINSLAIDLLIKNKIFIKFYPIHDGPSKVYEEVNSIHDESSKVYEEVNSIHDESSKDDAFKIKRELETNLRAELNEIWVKSWGLQPIEKILEYFGEKLALYFVWIEFYNSWLTVASIGGIIVVIYGIICALSQNSLSHGINGISVIVDNALTLPYAFFMSIWGVIIVIPKVFIDIGIYTTLVTAFVNLITMIIVKLLSKNLALKLTEMENHRTDTEYEDAADKATGCENDNCLIELTIQLAIILIGKQLFDQFVEIFMPNNFSKENLKIQLKNIIDKYKHHKKNTNVPQWVLDDYLADFPELQKNENGKIAFPLASFFSWINNLIEIKTDSFKYIKTTKRPVAYQAQDMGMWENILHALSIIGVLTNAIMIAFYSNWALAQFLKYTGDDDNMLLVVRLVFVLVFEHLVFIFKLIFVYFIPNQPASLRKAIEREKYLVKIKLHDFKPELDEYDDNNKW